ncbi:peptidase M23-like protein [Krasilnikovia cinnamomea]|uniref:Peptidase M23-like protein n=1 Tax=Krasilnikovia cinnamomea TaxID=349313 RepID=A0A4Q7ZMJ1_9ACTN|nr:M23 family metallopeptidase [Krasilnikovia cinnamomea]RZU52217.1 peptidase M23-like protein [Krasilnikovia cinnamomea]
MRGLPRRSRSALLGACLAVLTTAGLGLAGPAPAAADSKDDLRRATRAVQRAEAVLENATTAARSAARRLTVATAALPAAQRRVATARGAVAATQTVANTARRRADATRAAYRVAADRFAAAERRVEQGRERVDEIATATYMGAGFTGVNVLISATGPQDLLDRMSLVGQVMAKQQDEVDALVEARRDVRSEQDRAGLARRVADEAARAAADKLASARTAQVRAEQARVAVVRLTQYRRTAFRAARAQRAAVLERYREAKVQEQRIREALRRAQNGPDAIRGVYVGGQLLMPVRGAWKSSDFGWRYDPWFHVWQLHAGTDFAADSGTPIRAAAAGRVIQAGWYGGYGNYTCISHGRLQGAGFTTCYGHQSRIGVHPGQYVSRGEVIGRVGSTGASTGAHLHFETRIGGVPRNPLRYLPGCLC